MQKIFTWDEEITNDVYVAWEAKAKVRYRSLMHKIRNSQEKGVHLTEDTWQKWKTTWTDPTYKKMCEQFSKNRRSETGGPGSGVARHTGGSISHSQHRQRLVSIFKLSLDILILEKYY